MDRQEPRVGILARKARQMTHQLSAARFPHFRERVGQLVGLNQLPRQ